MIIRVWWIGSVLKEQQHGPYLTKSTALHTLHLLQKDQGEQDPLAELTLREGQWTLRS